jgi:hypothetical protein
VRLLLLVLPVLIVLIPVRQPTPIARLQHQIDDVSARVHSALSDLAAARTPAEKSRVNAELVDLRLELADLSDRVRMQSQP